MGFGNGVAAGLGGTRPPQRILGPLRSCWELIDAEGLLKRGGTAESAWLPETLLPEKCKHRIVGLVLYARCKETEIPHVVPIAIGNVIVKARLNQPFRHRDQALRQRDHGRFGIVISRFGMVITHFGIVITGFGMVITHFGIVITGFGIVIKP